MTYTLSNDGYISLEDSAKLVRAIFPNWPSMEPCHPAPALEPIQGIGIPMNAGIEYLSYYVKKNYCPK